MKFLQLLLFLVFLGCTSNSPAQTVYTTKTGEKYHNGTCRYLKHSKKEITLAQAINLGYQACSVCKPNASVKQLLSFVSQSSTSTSQQETTSQKTTAIQCKGKTQTGKRCKRMTKNANGRCYHH